MGNSAVNSVAQGVAGRMADNQKKMQQDMMAKQMDMQVRMQERMRRTMITQGIATARETFWWYLGGWSTITTGIITLTFRGKLPPWAVRPLFISGFGVAYLGDMAYGTKMERINRMMDDILTKEEHWFTPLLVTEAEAEAMKHQH